MAVVLVVEDDSQVLALATSILQNAGYKALSAGTVAEAQALIHSDHKLDLIFTDIGLANHPEGGITVGQMAAQERSGVPVLYTSGRAVTDGMKTLFAAKSSFLPKPYTDDDLIQAVGALLK
jgi:CheY-like chemotaxis protein